MGVSKAAIAFLNYLYRLHYHFQWSGLEKLNLPRSSILNIYLIVETVGSLLTIMNVDEKSHRYRVAQCYSYLRFWRLLPHYRNSN